VGSGSGKSKLVPAQTQMGVPTTARRYTKIPTRKGAFKEPQEEK